jgi:hypothetical protein
LSGGDLEQLRAQVKVALDSYFRDIIAEIGELAGKRGRRAQL